MKHVITSIKVTPALPAKETDSGPIQLPMIAGTGQLTSTTSSNNLTEDITLRARLNWTDRIEEILKADMSTIEVKYEDEDTGAELSFVFGSMDIPAKIQMENNASRSIKCVYKRAI